MIQFRARRAAVVFLLSIVGAGTFVAATASSTSGESCDPEGCSCAAPAGNRTSGSFLLPAGTDHYSRLATVDARSRPDEGGVDRRQFSLSAMNPRYLAILDAPPAYLDLPPDFITLPEAPANSSAQTRAELDHLLEIQATRTPEEVQRSQQLAGVFYRLSVKPGDADWPAMRRNLFHMGEQLGP